MYRIRRMKYSSSRFIIYFMLIILVWSIITCQLSYVNERKFVSNDETDIKINQKYCGFNECKFLFPYHVPEQETSANFHFYSFIQLAEMLNRTIVLVNVQYSRLESCKKFPFNFYYDVKSIQNMFPNVKFITQQNFLNWTQERDNRPTSTHRYIRQEKKTSILKTDHLDLKRECLNQFDLKFNNKDDIMINNKTTINLGQKGVWRERYNNILMTKNLLTFLDVNEEVLLIRHSIRDPLFPSKGPAKRLPYAEHIIEAADNAINQLKPYIAIHWRMEKAKPGMMSVCVDGLIKYINKLRTDFELFNVYLATDYPLISAGENKSQSSTFNRVTPQHHNAIKLLNNTFKLNTWVSMKKLNILFDKFPGHEKEINQEFQGPGIQGIFDKLVVTDSNYFISGPYGCAYVSSKFSKKIGETREKLMRNGDKKFLNNITRWPLNN